MYKFIKFAVLFLFCLFVAGKVCGQEQNDTYKATISIDLDGVLNNYEKYNKNDIPTIRLGAKEFIKELHKCGYKLVLFTNRKPLLATKWLIENDLDKYFSDVTNVKPMAIIYLDDRALKFNGDYNKTINDINNFDVYWKDK